MENIPTRAEHSRSLEDAERFQALETLTKLGLFIPASELEMFHGRVRSSAEEAEWEVDPTFANGGNDSGNSNFYARPVLYTADKATAHGFAQARKTELQFRQARMSARMVQGVNDQTNEAYQAEVHEIVSNDPDAHILDLSFDLNKLSADQKKEYHVALKKMIVPITEGSPLAFQDRDASIPFKKVANERIAAGKVFFDESDIPALSVEAGIPESVALQMASALNASRIALMKPGYLVDRLTHRTEDVFVEEIEFNNEKHVVPINLEYVQRYLRINHIVGLQQDLSSVTIGRAIKAVSFFDLEKTMSRKSYENKKTQLAHRLGQLSIPLPEAMASGTERQTLLQILNDAHAKPERLVEAASQVNGFDKIFAADAGNWEGYTLAEHTETVLRNFEENYADDMPVDLLAPMRLAIIVHDVGKPVARAHGKRHTQAAYNQHYAAKFMDKLGVDDKTQNLLLTLIGDAQVLAFNSNVRHHSDRLLQSLAADTLRRFKNGEAVMPAEVRSFVELAKILQVCDGGSYTSMAVTRSKKYGGRYRNAPSFNASFAQPHGFGKRTVKLRENGTVPAHHDLSPKGLKSAGV